jgi:diguanylate cyclase (GGDEF)-like protein
MAPKGTGAGSSVVLFKIMRRLAWRSRASVLTVSALSMVLLATADYLTGPELRFFIFYWPPIVVATWFGGRSWGLAFVALAGAAWAAANFPQSSMASWVLAWNAGVNLISFGFLAYVANVLREMMERERANARTDALTGAVNVRAFLERLAVEIKRCARVTQPVSLAYFDADDFKLVNDRLGHAAGDALLQRTVAIIDSQVRATDCLARLGGDEFALFMPGADSVAAGQAIKRIRAALGVLASATGLPISFSVGLVTCTDSVCTAEQLIASADEVMYEVKAAGKNGVRAAELNTAAAGPCTAGRHGTEP